MLPTHARVVIVGGGIVGTSVLYHLAREGWSDCVLVEKSELTSGSTWHAAGAITHAIASPAIARMAGYGIDLYQKLEMETGQSVSWHGCGSLRLAYTDDEVDYCRYILSVGKALGHPMELIGPAEIGRLHPFYRLEGVKAGLHTPADGHVDPAGATFAFAKGARQRGARISRRNRVTGIRPEAGGTWRVSTEQGDIVCEIVINAGGTFARQIGQWVGLDLPIVCAAHQYLITEPIAALACRDNEIPLVRDSHKLAAYFRQEQSSILMGFYEKSAPHLVWLEGTPWTSESELFEPDLDPLMPSLEIALTRMPILAEAGIRRVVNGAIMYTADGAMLAGPAPGLRNFWCACGVSVGVAWGPGVGKYLAQWLVHGCADINMRPFDPRRFGRFATYGYAIEKVKEDYVLRHEVAFPGRDRPAARPVRHSSLYERLRQQGAVFEQMFGWERPLWFAREGLARTPLDSFRRTAAHEMVACEAKAVRERVGVLDLSGFGKIDVVGGDAAAFLDRLTTNRVPARNGGVALTYLLNDRGTIEAELTCTRLGDQRFFLLFAALDEIRVWDWLQHSIAAGEDVRLANRSDDLGCLLVSGPLARDVLRRLTDCDLSNAGFPWLTGRELRLAGKTVRALRVSLVGELGWELHAAMADIPELYEALRAAGAPFGMENFGTAALNAMRIEKAFKGTRELNATSNLIETGMMRFARPDKGPFRGREALLRKAQEPRSSACVYLDVDAADSDCHGGEAVLDGGRTVGSITSAAFGPYVRRSLAFAFVEPEYARPGAALDVLVLGEARRARVLAEAAYDPANRRLLALG
jgi:dimethylglycine dehydrogenase